MNKSGIEWTQFTSNPIKGKCLHNCWYCYAEKIRVRYGWPEAITWVGRELIEIQKRKKPSIIFMGSMYDIFGEWVKDGMIEAILNTTRVCSQHTFLFLTKNAVRPSYFDFPENCWVGVTDDCHDSDTYPLDDFGEWITTTKKFISFEPLLGPLGTSIPVDVDQIIIGAMTGPEAIKPQRLWIDAIIEKAGDRPVFLKDNLLKLFPDLPRRQETAWRVI